MLELQENMIGKDTLPLTPLKIFLLSSLLCHFLAQFWKSSFQRVFRCVLVSWTDSKCFPFMLVFPLGKSLKSHSATQLGESGGRGNCLCLEQESVLMFTISFDHSLQEPFFKKRKNFQNCFTKWEERWWDKCVQREGNIFSEINGHVSFYCNAFL